MAETVVSLVLGKLADEVMKELIFLYGVRGKVERVQRDLTWIQSFLKDADSKRHKDERVKNWVNEVKEVGYLIEDTLDKFFIKVDEGRSDKERSEDIRCSLKRIGKLLKKLIAKHKLGKEIDKIHQRIREISESRTTYGIEGLKDSSTETSFNLPARPIMIPDIDETEVIGFEEDRKRIVEQLTDTSITRRSVLSIVGAGGSGKTSLAKEVYKSAEIKNHFVTRLWLTASEDYKLIDILLKMLEGIQQRVDLDTRQNGDQEYLITKLYNSMKEKKYLVVLDDVWSIEFWTQLKVALPNTTNGSRVMITTRFLIVAEEADAISKPFEIKGLNKEDSQQLLLKKAFPNQYASECPQDLLFLANDFAKKCGGWPLALVVLGGILSRKVPSYDVWDGIMRNMDWHTDGSRCMSVISTSYEVLPSYLKPCFMYFAVFSEDHQIRATTLIQLWIAEGFISPDASRRMEQIAECYLEELVRRCMVQVSRRSHGGKIKYCQLHDLLRELAIQKAKEDNFLTVFSKSDTNLNDSNSARRVALNFGGHTPLNHACTNLRSLTYSGEEIEISKRFELLRVLNVQLSKCDRAQDREWMKTLTALRYFRWKTNYIKDSRDLGAVTYLIHMKNLQIVDFTMSRDSRILPPSFWDNKLLRHVIFRSGLFDRRIPKGPPLTADLPNLQTLKWVEALPEWGASLPHFPRLRKLAMRRESVEGDSIVNSLCNLQDLESLSLEPGNEVTEFPYFMSHGYERLHSLLLTGATWSRKEVIVGCTLFPPHIVKIRLREMCFEEDPMPQLEKLPHLRVLEVHGMMAKDEGNRIITCSRGGFGCLLTLLLDIYQLEEWKIDEGAMPMLNRLELVKTNNLKVIPNIIYLTTLRLYKINDNEHQLTPQLWNKWINEWKISKISLTNVRVTDVEEIMQRNR